MAGRRICAGYYRRYDGRVIYVISTATDADTDEETVIWTPYVKQIKENLWEGRYSPVWPDGKKHSRNVYGHTEAECEEKLAELILQMKEEIAALRSGASTEYPDGVSPKKKSIAVYLREHPGVTSKGMIARELGMDRSTVQRYYDEIRVEFQMKGAE